MNRFLSLLGFAQRSGKLVSGEQGVESAVRRGGVHCLIIAEDSSNNTKRKFVAMGKTREITTYTFGQMDRLGQAIGKPRRAIIGVMDANFSQIISKEIADQKTLGEKN